MFTALVCGVAFAQPPAKAVIPPFTMTKWLNVERPVDLASYRGKVVVLHVSAGFC